MRKLKYLNTLKTMLVLLLACIVCSRPGMAQEVPVLNLDHFSKIPVLDGGRIKPIGSFARAQLKTLSGRTRLEDISANAFLSEALFDPARAMQRPVIKVRHPHLRQMLGLEKTPQHFYSYLQIANALENKRDILLSIQEIPEEEWSRPQGDLMMLQQNVMIYDQILGALSLFLPLAV